MSDYEVLDYIPVIGDIYRYGKLGYNIGSWIANNGCDYNNRVLNEMLDNINQAANSDNAIEAIDYINEAVRKIQQFDTENCKKYQVSLFLYLAAKIFHVLAICECIIYKDDLKRLKQTSSTFLEAKKYCRKVWNVDKTLLTEKRSIIDQLRLMSDGEKAEITKSKRKYRKQYRHLYKETYPIKWYMGMWIFS